MGRKIYSALPLFSAVLLVVFQLAATFVRAEEIVISGNGESSSNEVTVSSTNTTEVTQTNNADVLNDVDTSADTGQNSASDNTGGDTAIQTGNVSQELTVENSLNSSSVEVACCPTETSIDISSNGSESQNSVNITSQSNAQVVISQNASVTNNVSGVANTGDNQANGNSGGNVLIDTGDIWANGGIKNGPINVYGVEGGTGLAGALQVSIRDNGSGSTNIISALFADLANLWLYNDAQIRNDVAWDLNTGGNEANGNTGGDVTIQTGDILFDFLLENGPINVGGVEWGCCPPPGDGDGGPPPGDGGQPPTDGDGDGDGDGVSAPGPGPAGGVVLALAPTSGEEYPFILFGLALIAAGASVVKKQKFV